MSEFFTSIWCLFAFYNVRWMFVGCENIHVKGVWQHKMEIPSKNRKMLSQRIKQGNIMIVLSDILRGFRVFARYGCSQATRPNIVGHRQNFDGVTSKHFSTWQHSGMFPRVNNTQCAARWGGCHYCSPQEGLDLASNPPPLNIIIFLGGWAAAGVSRTVYFILSHVYWVSRAATLILLWEVFYCFKLLIWNLLTSPFHVDTAWGFYPRLSAIN